MLCGYNDSLLEDRPSNSCFLFFFNDPATTEIYTLSLHDALPIWDLAFDMVRAVKSEEELRGVRDSMDIIVDGFWALTQSFEPGKTEAEIMAPAVEVYFARGAGPRMMNIVLSGTNGEAEAHFKVPGDRRVGNDDL